MTETVRITRKLGNMTFVFEKDNKGWTMSRTINAFNPIRLHSSYSNFTIDEMTALSKSLAVRYCALYGTAVETATAELERIYDKRFITVIRVSLDVLDGPNKMRKLNGLCYLHNAINGEAEVVDFVLDVSFDLL